MGVGGGKVEDVRGGPRSRGRPKKKGGVFWLTGLSHGDLHEPFGADSEPIRSRFGADLEPIRSRFGADLEPIWSRFEPIWSRFEPICRFEPI